MAPDGTHVAAAGAANRLQTPGDAFRLCGESSRDAHRNPAPVSDSRQRSIPSIQKRCVSPVRPAVSF